MPTLPLTCPGFFSESHGADIGPHSQYQIGTIFPDFKKQIPNFTKKIPNSTEIPYAYNIESNKQETI
jgi:hypothetical protein